MKTKTKESGSRSQSFCFTFSDIKDAFTEWDRRYRGEPEHFMSEHENMLKDTPETYGTACANFFLRLIEEMKATTSV